MWIPQINGRGNFNRRLIDEKFNDRKINRGNLLSQSMHYKEYWIICHSQNSSGLQFRAECNEYYWYYILLNKTVFAISGIASQFATQFYPHCESKCHTHRTWVRYKMKQKFDEDGNGLKCTWCRSSMETKIVQSLTCYWRSIVTVLFTSVLFSANIQYSISASVVNKTD